MDDLFGAAGTLREAYQRFDWPAGPLGAPDGWSPALRAAADLALNTRNPVTLLWGPQYVLVYNEAYVPMIGDKHPAALGAPAAEVFAEIWDTIGPMLDAVAAGGGATWAEDLPLLMNRHGFAEETYFTFSYSAVHAPDGAVEGIIDIAAETTGQVVGARRLALLGRLTDTLADVTDVTGLIDRALPVLRSDPDDLPDVRIETPGPPDTGGGAVRIPLSDDAVLVTGLSPHLPVDDAYTGFLRLVGATLAQGLNRIRVRQVERRSVLLERQLSEALQRSLLADPVRADGVQIAVRYHPAAAGARIGGDWYDAFRLPDGRITVVVGDVSGHDRHAAAAMSQIRNLLRGISYALLKPPARTLVALNDAMNGFAVDVFATAVLARLDPVTGELVWSNAGHPPPMLLTPDGRVHSLDTAPEVLLGTRARSGRADHTMTLPPGSVLVLYTDGLVERRGRTLDDGLRDLTTALAGLAGRSAEDICDDLLTAFSGGAEDDIVLAVVQVAG